MQYILLTILSNHLSHVMIGNHWSLLQELHVTLSIIQKLFSIVGTCRIPQECSIAIQNYVTQQCIANCQFYWNHLVFYVLSINNFSLSLSQQLMTIQKFIKCTSINGSMMYNINYMNITTKKVVVCDETFLTTTKGRRKNQLFQ